MNNSESQNIQIKNLKVIISSLLLLLFFFLPWIFKASAWDLLTLVNESNQLIGELMGADYKTDIIYNKVYVLYLIPILSFYLIISALLNKNAYFSYAQTILFLIIFFVVNKFIFQYDIEKVSKHIGLGLWGTILVGVYFLIEFIYSLRSGIFSDNIYEAISVGLFSLLIGCELYAFYDLLIERLFLN
jgi:hypothetical protein